MQRVLLWKIYALILGVVDGFAGIIPLALLLTSFMGIQGLWLAFPLLSFLMMIGIFLVNHMIGQRSGGRYKGIFLFEYEDPDLPVYDSTVPLELEAISENSRLLEQFCRENRLSGKLSILVAVSFEEMSVYTMEQKEKNYLEVIDLLVKIVPDEVVMDIRSIGRPFDLMAVRGEEYGNVDILRKTASSIDI